ncbi:MAG: hypothetical protein WAV22_01645 [Porticoccaceae bacterium]
MAQQAVPDHFRRLRTAPITPPPVRAHHIPETPTPLASALIFPAARKLHRIFTGTFPRLLQFFGDQPTNFPQRMP